MQRYRAIIVALGILLLPVLFYAGRYAQARLTPKILPLYGAAPTFVLTDEAGAEYSSEDLRGKIWVADFIYTTCSTVCPVISRNLANVFHEYRDNPKVALVSITIDPEHDTPQALAKFKESLAIHSDAWRFLTGEKAKIEELAVRGFKVASEGLLHTDKFILVDQDGRVRGYYGGMERDETLRLLEDVAVLLRR